MSDVLPRTVRLPDGHPVEIRALTPDDREALADGFARLSDESRYRRFFAPMPRLPSRMLDYLVDIDHHDHEAIVAVDPVDGQGLGVARFIREPDGNRAELAITIRDDAQGRGIGRLLLDALADRAREEGLHTLTASVLADNPAAVHVISALGQTARRYEGQVVELEIALPDAPGAGPVLGELLRGAAAGSFVVVGGLLQAVAAWATPRRRRSDPRPGGVPQRIVVGTDGSLSAALAVAQATGLAASVGASLHVVSAYLGVVARAKGAVPDGLSDLGWLVSTEADARSAVAIGRRIAWNAGVEATVETRRGDPASVLLAAATDHDADLVVVGSKGLRGARRFLLGGVADKVARHAPCSVLIARTM